MKQKICIAALLFFLQLYASAQQAAKLKFTSISQAGVLSGAFENALQVQTINGVRYKTFFTGLGVGLDNYYYKTIPVFLDVRKNFFDKKQTPFIYLDLGVSLPQKKEEVKNLWTSQYKNAFYYDIGIGYTAPIKGKLAFIFSAGYAQKKLHETKEIIYNIIEDFPPYGRTRAGTQLEYFDYTFRRFTMKVGLVF